MVKRLAFLISALSSPYLVATFFGLLPIYKYAPSFKTALLWSAVYVGTVVAIPFLYILSRVLGNSITDMHVAILGQRNRPILAAITGTFICAALFVAMGTPVELRALVLTVSLNGVVFLVATEYAKISFHVGTYVGSVLTGGILISVWLLPLLAAVPAIIWARSYRGKHSLPQSLAGAALSTATTLTIFSLSGLL